MAKFCGKCGAKLDEATGLCPNCDADKLNEQAEKPESIETPKPKQDMVSESEKPLSKEEAKKKRNVDKKAAKKARKKEKWASMTFGRKSCKIILKLLLWLIVLTLFAVGVFGALLYLDVIEVPLVTAYREETLLELINEKSIVIEETTIDMISDTEGTATIIVRIPNYELLFKKAALTENPEQYLFTALVLKQYEVQEFETSARVTIENESTIIHSDDAVCQILDKALVNAINALSEVE